MKKVFIFSIVVCLLISSFDYAVTIDWVTVGNAGNANDPAGRGDLYGSVGYEYKIGKYEITAGQYTKFLNAVAATDTYGLYNERMDIDSGLLFAEYGCNIKRSGSMGSYTYSVASDWANRPVNYVSWYDCLRFCNWLYNGQPTGLQDATTTEDGAYDMSLEESVVRKPGASVWLPDENEWYKAAYHKNDGVTGNYFLYPTSSNTAPGRDALETTNPGNNANYAAGGTDLLIGSPYYRTVVGEFELSVSPYGTFDQGGNVWEWNETGIGSYHHRGLRGGSYLNYDYYLRSSFGTDAHAHPLSEFVTAGFRVASVIPEPATLSIPLDIRPGSCPNPLNVKSKGVLPVAILGSDVFDVNEIDIASLEILGVQPIRSGVEDVATPLAEESLLEDCLCTTDGPDGYLDLTLKFNIQDIVEAIGEVEDGDCVVLTLTSLLTDGTLIEGTDCVIIINKEQ